LVKLDLRILLLPKVVCASAHLLEPFFAVHGGWAAPNHEIFTVSVQEATANVAQKQLLACCVILMMEVIQVFWAIYANVVVDWRWRCSSQKLL
jgi:hypothetical protein